MSELPDFNFNPDLSLDAELMGMSAADALIADVEADRGALSLEQKELIVNAFAPGIAHFYDLARQAGVLAGSGDVIGAIELLGGEEDARSMLGDEVIDKLVARAVQNIEPDTFEA